MNKLLIVDGSLAKAHVSSYTRSDGTFVKEHDNGRQAAAPKKAAYGAGYDGPAKGEENGPSPAAKARFDKKAGKAPAFDHPNVVAHNARMTSSHYEPGKGSKEVEAEHVADADTVHFAGKRYSWTSKTGKSNHDGTPVRAFEHEESGHRVWVDDKRRVHADSTDEVESLRKQHADHEAKQGAPAKKVVVRKAAMADHAAHHSSEADRHMAASTAALKDDFDKGSTLHDKAATAHERAMNAHKSGAANAAELSAAAREASAKADAVFEHKSKPKAPAAAAQEGEAKKPGTWQEAQEHAVKSGAKFKSSVAVFNSADRAHSYADRSAGSKGGAFVMKHPDHNFHMVVNGADSQRMAKNGYQYARRT